VRQPAPTIGAEAPRALTEAPNLEQAIRAWYNAGHSQRAIARELNIDRRKVKRVVDAIA
jgi:DNA-binding transcriptional regulator LsrR (DeoR family)